ncbi:ABC transporter substrate-binding protein [Paenibacillus sp. MSJ-34]|uniref:ABC transporter substrate-binding protein n=1 Tax=Paenibacillus sp. MSJ-34 TaxID=2841529 RepID=UPI001C0FDFE4|nr:extracellular solute-binding protein [Paenibacillus sp. MSJ-34]MBU5445435.1 extracellular solute-binding protein [Paenibacillus sp. MSJ-34]
MRKTNWFKMISVVMAAAFLLAACGNAGTGGNPDGEGSAGETPNAAGGNGGNSKVTLTVMTNVVGEPAKVLQDIANKFMDENPDIKVDFSAPGAEYENIMKMKMASNELPDVFSTHGWAKVRYGQYLADLKDEEWASKLDASIKPSVTDEEGKVYVLPMDQDKGGPVYNASVLEEYGVEVPATWDELLQAAETIKTKSGGKVAPIHIGGADSWPIGQFFDFYATSVFVSPEQNDAEQLLDGTFDWNKFDVLPQMFLDLQEKGYLNKDVLTAKYSDSAKAFAEGKAAFGVYGPFLIEEAKAINPELKAGLMPIQSVVAGDTPTLVGGEKTTWGVWKDSPNSEAARKFVAYFAKPENVALVAASNALPPGLEGVAIDAGSLTADYEKYKDLRVFPYFDRVYLPNGMWDVMCKNGQDMLAGAITPREYSENMKKEYERLRAASQ